VHDPQLLLDLLDVGVIVQEPDLRIVYANPKATALLGLSASEITDRTTNDARWDIIFADGTTVGDLQHPGVQALRTGEPVHGQLLGVSRGHSQERVWILVSASPEFDAHGRVARVVVSFSDVSETQREVREQDAIYQTVFSSLTEGIVIHEADGSIRTANAAAEHVLGLSIDQMTGREATDPRWRLIHPDGSPIGADEIPSEIARATGASVATRVLGAHRPSGEIMWLRVRADPLREPGDTTLRGVVATFADVTRERDTERALEASRAQSQRVLDAVPGVVYQSLHPHEGPGRIVFAAGRIREVLGLDPEEVRASPETIFQLLSPEDEAELVSHIARTASAGEIFEYETRFVHPSEGTRWVRLRGEPEPTPEGLLYTGVILDVTQARNMAGALRQTQRREAMGEIAAGVAHNFNNMLAVILPNVELARAGVAPSHVALLDDAERAARNAADLVKRMLALGRSDSVADASTADFAVLVRDVAHICRQTFDRSISVVDNVAVAHAHVRGASSDLHQVVLNLCLNARDAMADVTNARLRLILVAAGDDDVLLTVEDNGVGMHADVLARIGEPFFTTKEPGKGTGLGLAASFNTILEAEGSWQVHSEVGIGTTFQIRLRTVQAIADAVMQNAGAAGGGSGTVMLVDDEPMVRDTLARQLQHIGYRVDIAHSAEDALEQLRINIAPDLRAILLDRSMPGLSGDQALPLVQAAAPGVPIIILSGYVDTRETLAAAAVLQKPVGLRALQNALSQVISYAT